VIFEIDYSKPTFAKSTVAHFAVNSSRIFRAIQDIVRADKFLSPRLISKIDNQKLVYSFDSSERANVEINPWKSEFTQVVLTIEGIPKAEETDQEKFWNSIISLARKRLNSGDFVVASAPAKVNLYFEVGSLGKDGFHEVASLYQALSLRDYVRVERDEFSIGFSGPFGDLATKTVPTGRDNLVARAAQGISDVDLKGLSFLISKSIPIAGGMAGGSADAAAALLATNELLGFGASDSELLKIASHLGADVPFSLLGGSAIGTGRGESLTVIKPSQVLHFVITPSQFGLSTPSVYHRLDTIRVKRGVNVTELEAPAIPEDLLAALRLGQPELIAQYMKNDLQEAAIELMPGLLEILTLGEKLHSLKSMVSGSGPTVIHLTKSRTEAELLASRLTNLGFPSLATYSTQFGSRVES
jgi:4-diphosphocytidyl-2-C-methyl-D-erythritol kinase